MIAEGETPYLHRLYPITNKSKTKRWGWILIYNAVASPYKLYPSTPGTPFITLSINKRMALCVLNQPAKLQCHSTFTLLLNMQSEDKHILKSLYHVTDHGV